MSLFVCTRTESWSYRPARSPQRGEGVSGARSAASPCENLVCALKLSANQLTGRRHLCGYVFRGSPGADRIEDHDGPRRFSEVDCHEALKGRRPAEEIASNQSGRAPLRHQRSFKEVLSALSSTPPKWRLAGGHHRWCAKTGTQSAKPSTTASRERQWENLYYKFVGK